MLLRIYSSLGSRPSLFDRRWVCGFGRSGKLGRCRALIARGPVSGPADARRCCLVSSPARTIPRLWAARQGPSAILESLAGDGIGPAWYAGGDISGESRGSVNCSPVGILRSLAADARGGEDRCALSPRWFSPQWEGRGTDCFRGGRRRLRNLIAFRQRLNVQSCPGRTPAPYSARPTARYRR